MTTHNKCASRFRLALEITRGEAIGDAATLGNSGGAGGAGTFDAGDGAGGGAATLKICHP